MAIIAFNYWGDSYNQLDREDTKADTEYIETSNPPEKIMENAIKEFSEKVQAITGKAARESDIARFIEQAETAIAHRQARFVQIGFADFRTLSGRAALIEVAF